MILTRQCLANLAAERWFRQYEGSTSSSNAMDIHQKLMDLGNEPLPEEVDKVIGNGSWTRLPCHNCRAEVDVVVVIDTMEEYDIHICKTCLSTALEEIKQI